MNRSINEAIIHSFHYITLDKLSIHLKDYPWTYSSVRLLQSPKKPIGFISNRWDES